MPEGFIRLGVTDLHVEKIGKPRMGSGIGESQDKISDVDEIIRHSATAWDDGDHKAARRILEEALDRYPDSAVLMNALSVLLIANGDFKAAMQYVRQFFSTEILKGVSISAPDDFNAIARAYHEEYYHRLIWTKTFWRGYPVLKTPNDLWIYQEIITEYKPDFIIETGTYAGGSALYIADMCDLVGHGRVITVDLKARPSRPRHRRIRYVIGSSIDQKVIATITAIVNQSTRTLVILDSLHKAEHVEAELEAYAPFVRVGGYLVVEDTNLGGHPVWPEHGPGPREAVAHFLERHPEFVVDESREKFMMTFNEGGYLKRIHE